MRDLWWRLRWRLDLWLPVVEGHWMHPLDYLEHLARRVSYLFSPPKSDPYPAPVPRRRLIVEIECEPPPRGASVDWRVP